MNKIVSYEWEPKYYYGNIVAVHKNSDFFAYSLKGLNITSSVTAYVFLNHLVQIQQKLKTMAVYALCTKNPVNVVF